MADPQSRPEVLPASNRNEPENTNPATYATTAINTGSPVVAIASNQNALTQQADRNLRYGQESQMFQEDILGTSTAINTAVGGVGLTYPIAAGFTHAPATTDVFYLDGKRVDLRQAVLDSVGESTHTFPANSRTWIYATGARIERNYSTADTGAAAPASSGTVSLFFHERNVADPPAPPAGWFVVGGVETDGAGIIVSVAPGGIPAPYTLEVGVVGEVSRRYENPNDEISFTVVGNTTLVPSALFQSNNTGAALQAVGTAPTTGPAFLALNPGAGQCIAGRKFNVETADILDLRHSGASGRCIYAFIDTGNNTDEAAELQAFQTETCLVLDPTGGAALRMNSQPFNPSLGIAGEMSLVGSDLIFNRSGNPDMVWITTHGQNRQFATDLAGAVSNNADTLLVSNGSVILRQNARYTFHVRARIQQAFGSTQRVDLRVEVGGVPIAGLPGNATQIPSSTSPLAYGESINYTHTVVDGLYAVDFYLDSTPSGLGPVFTITYIEIIIEGHYD